MFAPMKRVLVLFLLSMSVAQGNEVAKVTHLSGPLSVFRNFEQLFLSKGSKVLRRDLLKLDEGKLTLETGKSKVLTEGPASFQIQRKNRHLELILHNGRILMDCRGGESWELKNGRFSLRGEAGVFHAFTHEGGLDVARLEGPMVDLFLNGAQGKSIEKGVAGLLSPSSNRLQYSRELSSFEIQVFKDSLVGAVVQAGDMLLDLDGKPFVPFKEILREEDLRRLALLGDNKVQGQQKKLRNFNLGKVEGEFDKNLEEAVDEDVGFSFPVPLSPIPSP